VSGVLPRLDVTLIRLSSFQVAPFSPDLSFSVHPRPTWMPSNQILLSLFLSEARTSRVSPATCFVEGLPFVLLYAVVFAFS